MGDWRFGLPLPEGVIAEIEWGARAILNGDGYLDIPPDRQQMSDYENPARKKLAKWIPKQLKKIEKLKLDMVTGKYEADDGKFHIRANTNRSHGYLYIVAWMDKEIECSPSPSGEVQNASSDKSTTSGSTAVIGA